MPVRWPFVLRVKVPWRDLDAAGHVNNAVYFSYMETARTELHLALVGGARWQDLDIILARAACDFRSPATFGETLEVRVRPLRVGASSYALGYEIVEERSGRLVAQGESVQVMFDYGRNEKKAVPAALREALASGTEGAPTAA
ncbi:MAG TPA: thioesterase family protein [Candidatus Thermoplasmatota archaeon]|nr:thioesterase family protein [Candidatus Thermoplasmatota archaeon]